MPSRTSRPRSRRARATISTARGASSRQPPPTLIAVGGLSGTGKSVLARALAAGDRARARRGGAALRRRAQGCCSASDEHETLPPRRLRAGGDGARLCHCSPTRRAAPSRPAIRPSSMRCSPRRRSARPSSSRAAVLGVPFHGLFLTADLDYPPRPRRRAQRRRLRRRRRGGARAGELRSRRPRLDAASMPPARPEETLARAQAALGLSADDAFDPRKLAVATAGFCTFVNLYSPQALLPALAREFGVGAAEISTIMTASDARDRPDRAVHRRDRRRARAQARDRRRDVRRGGADGRGGACAATCEALIAWRFVQGLLLPPIFAVTVAYIGDEWPARAGRRRRRHLHRGLEHRRVLPAASSPGVLADLIGWRGGFLTLAALSLAGAIMRRAHAAARERLRALGRARRLGAGRCCGI